ncbi:MAG TPA: hypothetical protein VEI04_06770 [Syntrophobacteria bacterium]|nr:hypothetical protein [Syntrophobacteria bacterium]
MKKGTLWLSLVVAMIWGLPDFSMSQSPHQGHGDMSSTGAGTMGPASAAGMFTHQVVDQGVRAEFQIMSMASMNMKDAAGATHHVMVKFVREGTNEQIRDAIARVRVVSPSGKEQVETLKGDGGIYAASFTLADKGTYGVVCVFKVGDQQHLVKFSYPNS